MSVLLRAPVLSYAVLTAAVIVVTATLPGSPSYAESGGASLGGAIFWSAVVTLGIALHWRPFWYVAILLDLAWLLVTAGLAVFELDPKSLLVAVLQAGIVRILLSRELDDRMWHRASAPA